MSSETGKNIRLTIFGQSHSAAVGGVIDGLPAGIIYDETTVGASMARRAPGSSEYTTQRKEADLPEILSGLKNGRTCDAPLAFIIRNTDVRSGDYSPFESVPRPSHSDRPASVHAHGFNDLAGGGHYSARLTAPLTFAGALLVPWLKERGIRVGAHLESVGTVRDRRFDPMDPSPELFDELDGLTIPMIDEGKRALAAEEIVNAANEGDSVGGVVEIAVTGLPEGKGSPIFGCVESEIARTFFGIPAVKGLEFGSGFGAAELKGSENNDPYAGLKDGRAVTLSNHAGGVVGGLTTGMPLIFRAAFKPTPSIAKAQKTFNFKTGMTDELAVSGRHDPCVALRAVPVCQAAAAFCVADLLLS